MFLHQDFLCLAQTPKYSFAGSSLTSNPCAEEAGKTNLKNPYNHSALKTRNPFFCHSWHETFHLEKLFKLMKKN